MENIGTRKLEENTNSLLHTTERQRLIQTPELPEAKRFCSLTHGKSESWSLIAHNTARQLLQTTAQTQSTHAELLVHASDRKLHLNAGEDSYSEPVPLFLNTGTE